MITAPNVLHQDIKFAIEQGLYRASEIAIGEQLIYPILKEVWKNHFVKQLLLWSHTAFSFDNTLSGIPHYLFAKRTEYDNAVVGSPILVTIKAKKIILKKVGGNVRLKWLQPQKQMKIPYNGKSMAL